MNTRALQALSVFVTIVVVAMGLLMPVDMAIRTWFSLSFLRAPDPRVVTVEVDERALSLFGRWPWPRSVLAQLVTRVAEAGPAAIGIDVILSEPDPDGEGDILLAQALGKCGRVVLPMYAESHSLMRGSQCYSSSSQPMCPIAVLADEAASVGHVVVVPDGDGVVRRVPMVFGTCQGLFPAFSAEVVCVGLGMSDEGIPFISHGDMDLTSSLAPAFPLPSASQRISAADLLATDVEGRSAAAELSDKFVLIGVTAAGIGDRHQTPISSRTGPMPGLLIHAAAVNAMISGDVIRSVSPGYVFLSLLCTGMLLCAVDGRMRCRERHIGAFVLVHGCVVGAVLTVSAILYSTHLVWIGPSAFALLSIGLLGVELYSSSRRGRQLKAALSRYAGMDSPEDAAREVSAGTREMAVMFADLRGWTAASYGMDPVRAAELVNEYLSALADAVAERGGRIEGFPGDAVFAVFEGHGREDLVHAVCAAVAVRETAAAVARGQTGESLLGSGQSTCLRGVGVGIVYGSVARAELGGADRAELTVVGSTVNIAKALEDAAHEGQILVGIPNDWPEEEVLAVFGPRGEDRTVRCVPWNGVARKVHQGSVRVFEVV